MSRNPLLKNKEESRQQCLTYEQQIHEQEQYHQERSVFEEDLEIIEANRPQPGHFMWPPPVDENRCTPTATPLYIPPPGTQHVVPKPVTEKPPEQQWQSRSAPELTSGQQKGVEIESSSDSYTSTSTTTTTTSEEYQRMYQAQVQAYQMQQAYEQSCSEMDYHMDMEVAATYQDQSFSSANYYSSQSGRKSAQECVEYISGPVSTYHLIDLVRAATPKPETPPPKPPRKVEFSDEIRIQQTEKSVTENTSEMTKAIKEKYEEMQQNQRKEKSQEDQTSKTTEEDLRIERAEVSADNRKFAATPEIKIEIPEVKPIPPSNIPNPVPKEWVSPMVKALTTAPDKPVEIAETSQSEATRAFESVHFKVEEDIKEEKTVQTESTKLATEPQILHEEPPKGSFLTKTMTTAPTDKIKFVERSDEPISLPEETQPYMPPPIDMKPYYRDDYRPKSPFLDALTIAPDRSYTPYGHDVCSQLLDLPTAKEKLTMVDALTVAPPRCYTPLNSSNATTLAEEQKKEKGKYQYYTKDENVTKQSIDTEINRQISAFANVKGSNGNTTFQPRRESLNSHATNTNHSLIPQNQSIQSQRQDSHQSQDRITNTQKQSMFQSVSSATTASAVATSYHSMNQTSCSKTSTTCKKEQQQQQCQTSTATKQQHHQQTEHDFEQKISFPPPPGPMAKKMVLSGLHKPDSIPQYQRNWTVLPSQRPVRTPEPPELKENVPLAFVETPTPRELTPSIEPSAQMKTTTSNSTASSSYQQHEATLTATKVSESRQQQQYQQIQQSKEQMSRSTLPIIVTENDAPVTMAFQSLDVDHGESQSRPYTPSLINKPAPIIPYYQTPAKLVAEECSATQARLYDPRSPSPLPDRARSPAPGPPPNPLSAIRAPRLKEPSYEVTPNYRPPIQAGSITTGQSYYGTQQAQFQTVEQGNVVSHYQTGYQAGSQSFIDKPEVVQQRQIGNTTIQTREKESKMNEENRSAMETKSTTQVGNMQIERRRKVVEEFEHTQTAKSIEIRKTHGDDSKQTTQYHQAGRTGFVANQARRLSNLEQEISSVSSQSQAISARAANLAESSDSIFPHYKSPEPDSKFPIKTYLPPHDEPSRATYVVSADATNKLVGNSAAHKADTSAKVASHTYATLSSQQQHQSFSQGQSISSGAAKSSITNASSSISSAAATSSAASATFGTDASKLTTTTSTAIPVPAFKLPTPFTSTGGPSADQLLNNANQQAPPLAQSQATTNNAAYKPPTSGLGPAGFKAPPPPTSSISVPNVVNDPSPASAGPTSKGGAFGATSAPKRGRGILNKAVGPGVRIPMCGCCHAQIR